MSFTRIRKNLRVTSGHNRPTLERYEGSAFEIKATHITTTTGHLSHEIYSLCKQVVDKKLAFIANCDRYKRNDVLLVVSALERLLSD